MNHRLSFIHPRRCVALVLLAAFNLPTLSTGQTVLPTFNRGQDPAPGRWQLRGGLSDEFNGTELNTSKWATPDDGTNWRGRSAWRGRPPGYFDKQSVSIRSGRLYLSGDRFNQPVTRNGRAWTHRGARVFSQAEIGPGHYFETSMKRNRTFMSSTFWLASERGEIDNRGTMGSLEFDIMEHVGVDTVPNNRDVAPWANEWDRFWTMTIRNGRPNASTLIRTHREPSVNRNGFHVFGCYWKNNNEVQVYLDGKLVRKFNPRIANSYRLPMRIEMVLETYDHNPAPGWPRGNYTDSNFRERIIQSFVSGNRNLNISDGKPGSLRRGNGQRRPLDVRSVQYEYVRVWRRTAAR